MATEHRSTSTSTSAGGGSAATQTLGAAPDLRRLYATAALHRGNDSLTLPAGRVALDGVRVAVDDLADYAHLCGFPLGGPLPLTYPHLLGFPLQMHVMSGRGFPLPLLGAVHVENAIRVHRALTVDDPLDIVVWAENLRPHRRGRQVDLVTEVSTRGVLAWRGVSTYLARGPENLAVDGSQPPSLTPLDGIRQGPQWRVPEGAGRAYAAVSGDWNPIHVHALTARPLGFPTAIAHGMFTYARTVAALGPKLPEHDLTSRVWFRKPVRLPSTVRLRSAVEPGRTLSLLQSADAAVDHAVVEHTW